MQNKDVLIIQVEYGGLGDHLFYSHIPKIAKESGYKKVLISNKSIYRSNIYKKLIWESNPWVDGFTDEKGIISKDINPKVGNNLLDEVMLSFGLDDGKRFHEPEIYIETDKIKDLESETLYDPNYVSYVGDIQGFQIQKYIYKNNINIDAQMKLLKNKGLPVTNNKYFISAENIYAFIKILKSVKHVYCLSSGTATLCAALGISATVFYGNGQNKIFHHSKLHTFINISEEII